jgi:replicative DNA helicase
VTDVLDFYAGKGSGDVPMVLQNKLMLLKKIIEMKLNGKQTGTVIDSLFGMSKKYSDYQSFVEAVVEDPITVETFTDIVLQVRMRKKIKALFENYDSLANILNTIRDGTFDSIDDLVGDYETTIKLLYQNLMDNQRQLTMESTSSLDFAQDDYSHAVEQIKKKYLDGSRTSTGFKSLDKFLNGGFEPSREYIFAGTSGSGKSTLMTNMIARSAQALNGPPRINVKDLENKTPIKHVYVYVTMENTADESLMRIYQDVRNVTAEELLDKLRSGELTSELMKSQINEKISPNAATIVMKYFSALTISPVDIMGVLDEVESIYGKGTIAGIFIDYLDLLTTDSPYDLYRLELAKLVLSLKSMAIQYNIPVITATQLNRSAYRVENPKDLGADQLGESIKKVEHSDMVMVLHKIIKDGVDVVIGKIAKFRSGRSGYAIESRVDFEKFRFGEFTVVKNEDKRDNVKSRRTDDIISMDACNNMMSPTTSAKKKNAFSVGEDGDYTF